jgi:FkbM family methyltransferase
MSLALTDGLVSLIPARERILRRAARMPPRWRSRQSCRLFSALARRTGFKMPTMSSNLGISPRLACEVPVTQMVALYGLPALYTGERGSLELAARLSRDCAAFVDIGAHLGYFTFYVHLRGQPDLPIVYFEPDPKMYAALERNVRANGLERIRGYERAVGALDGTSRFFSNHTDSLSGSLHPEFAAHHDLDAVDVTVERFATLASRLQLTRACVKVDVEGAETEFLEGASGALDRIAYLIMEVLGPAHARGFVASMMARGGFHAYYINDYTLEHSRDGSFAYRAPEYNWLFCRDEPRALAVKLAGSRLRVRA